MFNSQTGCVSNFIEQDGCARTVIVLLLLTTVGCISYTWGYYEGIANEKSNKALDCLHELQLLKEGRSGNGTEHMNKKHSGGHGLRLAESRADEVDSNRALKGQALRDTEVTDVTKAAASLEDATTTAEGERGRGRGTAAQLRGAAKGARLARKGTGAHNEEGET